MDAKKMVGFLGHHVGDLAAIAEVLGFLVDALPINQDDKKAVKSTLGTVSKSAKNISDSLKRAEKAASKGAAPKAEKAAGSTAAGSTVTA